MHNKTLHRSRGTLKFRGQRVCRCPVKGNVRHKPKKSQLMYSDRTADRRVMKAKARRRYATVLALVGLCACVPDSERPLFTIDPGASGPLTLGELQMHFGAGPAADLTERQRDCVLREVASRAASAGDPEALDPVAVAFLPKKNWGKLDSEGKRIILAQAITTKAFFECD